MAGTSPIVTRGFNYTIALVVTAGYGSAAIGEPLYALVAETKQFSLTAEDKPFLLVAETKPFALTAEDKDFLYIADTKLFVLVANREDIALEHVKYYAETYVLSMNFVNRVRSGQTITSGTVTVTDSDGNDVSNTIVNTGTVSVSSTSVLFTLRPNAGTVTKTYRMKIMANTAVDVTEQDLNLQVI